MINNAKPNRLSETFDDLKRENRAAFIPFIMAGDPNLETSLSLMKALPDIGADIIELGVCFTDPMADGPAIQAAGLRALAAGQTLLKTLDMVSSFRMQNKKTPVILMGYYNVFYAMGVEKFLANATKAGVDGLIIVDLPPEEDQELCLPARAAGVDFIRLATPTTDDERLGPVLKNSSGFVYYVSVAGITGQSSGQNQQIAQAVNRIRGASPLPVAVGFGIKTTSKAAEIAQSADGVVVGSAIVENLAATIEKQRNSTKKQPAEAAEALESGRDNTHYNVDKVIEFANDLAVAVHGARK